MLAGLGLGLFAGAWLGAAGWLERVGQRPPNGSFDAIIVAGCPPRPDGSPSPALLRRTTLAVTLFQRGHAPRLILTGGGGPVAEADVAAAIARSLGVDASAVTCERESRNTEENARFSARLVQGRVLVVSDSWHVWRCVRVFRRHHTAVVGVGAVGPTWSRSALREVGAILIYGLRGRL